MKTLPRSLLLLFSQFDVFSEIAKFSQSLSNMSVFVCDMLYIYRQGSPPTIGSFSFAKYSTFIPLLE